MPVPGPSLAPPPPRYRASLLLAFACVFLLRLAFCFVAPAETTDVLRNLGYGRNFWTYGFAVYDLRPGELLPLHGWESLWWDQSYLYPVFTLLFFAVLASVSTSLIVARVVLTVCELMNAALVGRLTGSAPLALLYFASPASAWWVSGEGQFEPIVILPSLLSLYALRRGHTAASFALLGVAVQTKLFPLLLLPALLARLDLRRVPVALGSLLLSLVPSVLLFGTHDYLGPLWAADGRPRGFNPLAWNIFHSGIFAWVPGWLVAWNAVVTYALLGGAIAGALAALRRRRYPEAVSCLPLIAFLVVIKSMALCGFWYLLLAPALALAIEDERPRRALFCLALLEGRGTTAAFLGPVANYQFFPIQRFLRGGA